MLFQPRTSLLKPRTVETSKSWTDPRERDSPAGSRLPAVKMPACGVPSLWKIKAQRGLGKELVQQPKTPGIGLGL